MDDETGLSTYDQWTDAKLDEDIKALRENNHDYKGFLENVALPRYLIRYGLPRYGSYGLNEMARQMTDHSNRITYNRTNEHMMLDPKYQRMADYENALVARYLTHYDNEGNVSRELTPHYLPGNSTLDFDKNIKRMSSFTEQEWEEMLGYHPVHLPRAVLKLTYDMWHGHPWLKNMNPLENKIVKEFALKQTTDMRQERLTHEYLDKTQGALNFAQILKSTNKRYTIPFTYNSSSEPEKESVITPGGAEDLALGNAVRNMQIEHWNQHDLGQRLDKVPYSHWPMRVGNLVTIRNDREYPLGFAPRNNWGIGFGV